MCAQSHGVKWLFLAEVCAEREEEVANTSRKRLRRAARGLLSPRSCVLQANCCSAGLLAKCVCGSCHSGHLCVFVWKFSGTCLPLLVENSYSFFCANQELRVWAGFELLV